MDLSRRTHQAQFIAKRLTFKGLNFTASTYSAECKNGEWWGQWGAAGQPCLVPRAPSQGVNAWFLCLVTHLAHTTGPFVVACVPSTACCRACFKCSLCVTALKEQRRSVRAVCRSAAAKNTTRGESHVGAKRFHSKLS